MVPYIQLQPLADKLERLWKESQTHNKSVDLTPYPKGLPDEMKQSYKEDYEFYSKIDSSKTICIWYAPKCPHITC